MDVWSANLTLGVTSRLPVIRPKQAADCSDRRLHGQDGTKSGLALRNTVVGLRCLKALSVADNFVRALDDRLQAEGELVLGHSTSNSN
jgi:hypothetical protein